MLQRDHKQHSRAQPPAGGASPAEDLSDDAGWQHGLHGPRQTTSSQQHGTRSAGLRSLLGAPRLSQQPQAAPAREAEEAPAAHPAAATLSTRRMPAQADDQPQLFGGRQEDDPWAGTPSSGGVLGTRRTARSGGGSGGSRPALADASNRAEPMFTAGGQPQLAWEWQAESPGPEEGAGGDDAVAGAAEDICGASAPAAVQAAAGAEDAAGSMVQQCESIFTFL